MRILNSLLLVALASLSGPAWACTCIPPGTTAHEFKQSTHVFVGVVTTVEYVEPPPPIHLNWFESLIEDIRSVFTGRKGLPKPVRFNPYNVFTFNVQEQFKGARSQVLSLREAPDSAACGYSFERGKTYVVYAQTHQGNLVSGICSLTGQVTDSRTGISQLRAGI